jgi:Protein of unknown function (DUF3093)
MTLSPEPLYRERLWPAIWLYFAVALVIPASVLVFLPINLAVGFIVAIVLYLGAIGVLLIASPRIAVTRSEFIAGRARLPIAIAGAPESFTGTEATAERGVRLDSRAWLLIRGWINPVVRVGVLDEKDPVPYWLVSTRHPHAVVAAIRSARGDS